VRAWVAVAGRRGGQWIVRLTIKSMTILPKSHAAHTVLTARSDKPCAVPRGRGGRSGLTASEGLTVVRTGAAVYDAGRDLSSRR
jgi:hypothetical protein